MRLAVAWIDWYAYHVARFRALAEHPLFRGQALGIEMVGRTGVHPGLVFRHEQRDALNIVTLMPQESWSSAGQVRLSRLLWNKLDEFKPDAVLVPGYYTWSGISAALWAKRRARRSILMTESTRQDHPRRNWKEAGKSLLLKGLFDGAIAGGRRHREYLTSLGMEPGSIGVRYDVVDNEFFRRECDLLRQRPGANHDLPAHYFLYVGRFAPEKNLEFLIRSYLEYRARGGEWSLVLAGDGPEFHLRREQAERSAYASDIHFTGLKTTPELVRFFAFAGAFVLPSTREPWGLVVNEAMAAGLPVIVSHSCGCVDDLVEQGANGFTFDPREELALTEALSRMSAMEPNARRRMSERSLQIISEYSPTNWAEEIARVCTARTSTHNRAA
jgi:1,2-diacylglycerol 3-alpha-glucosyltransferase